ncbi:LOW QUALITY PROTEIN: hypothetical protein RJ641_028400 [Dillenia turbinata]|uniref:Uncharacterized protein n=1 Tax=Dillenia turbinata TaxID=194707 RepID=A0AAN8ZQH4_9MAGN
MSTPHLEGSAVAASSLILRLAASLTQLQAACLSVGLATIALILFTPSQHPDAGAGALPVKKGTQGTRAVSTCAQVQRVHVTIKRRTQWGKTNQRAYKCKETEKRTVCSKFTIPEVFKGPVWAKTLVNPKRCECTKLVLPPHRMALNLINSRRNASNIQQTHQQSRPVTLVHLLAHDRHSCNILVTCDMEKKLRSSENMNN